MNKMNTLAFVNFLLVKFFPTLIRQNFPVKNLCCTVMHHLESNLILSEAQHGFRHNQSCESQLVSLLHDHDLTYTYDQNIQTDMILLDLPKAFDTVPHRRLQYKLDWYGIQEKLINGSPVC